MLFDSFHCLSVITTKRAESCCANRYYTSHFTNISNPRRQLTMMATMTSVAQDFRRSLSNRHRTSRMMSRCRAFELGDAQRQSIEGDERGTRACSRSIVESRHGKMSRHTASGYLANSRELLRCRVTQQHDLSPLGQQLFRQLERIEAMSEGEFCPGRCGDGEIMTRRTIARPFLERQTGAP